MSFHYGDEFNIAQEFSGDDLYAGMTRSLLRGGAMANWVLAAVFDRLGGSESSSPNRSRSPSRSLFFCGRMRTGGSTIRGIGMGRLGGMMMFGFLITGRGLSLMARGVCGGGCCLSWMAGTSMGPYSLSLMATRAAPGGGGGGGGPLVRTGWNTLAPSSR